MEVYKLCYVEDCWAWFTTQDLDKQWGDDWNDAPYEHNAGNPYSYSDYDKQKGRPEWKLMKLAFDAPMETPAQRMVYGNSRYSVEQINRGDVAWLRPTEKEGKPIHAGCTPEEFKELIRLVGGTVYEAVP